MNDWSDPALPDNQKEGIIDVEELIQTTKRQQRSEETRKRLMDAIDYIMDQYDYNTVTIRNICKVSGVAYGSFYNLFDSKEDFLRYNLTSGFVEFKNDYYQQHPEFASLNPIDKSIDIYVCCAHYNVHKGIKYISAFYSPQNSSLCPIANTGKEYSFSPLVAEAQDYLTQARAAGLLKKDADIEQMVHEYCFIFNGITFNWCISGGQYDMTALVKRYLEDYVRGVNH